jgi:antitoxin MazE
MQLNIVQIGNSKGIRIPKAILEQCQIEDQVDLEVENGRIILEPKKKTPREGWGKAFKDMASNEDDALLIDDSVDIEIDHWEW